MTPRIGRPRLVRWARTLGVSRAINAVVRKLPHRIQATYERAKARAGLGRSTPLVPTAELERHYREALEFLVRRDGAESIGDYLEFGVYAGASLGCMYRALEGLGLAGVRLFGFDSFAGLPAVAAVEGAGHWQPGQFRSDLEFTRWNLQRSGVPLERVTLVPGWFEETATSANAARLGMRHASIVLIDCDLYSSALTALEFCAPRFGPTAVIFFDEWSVGAPAAAGFDERRAFDTFLAGHPELHAEELGALGRYKKDSRAFVITRDQGVPVRHQ